MRGGCRGRFQLQKPTAQQWGIPKPSMIFSIGHYLELCNAIIVYWYISFYKPTKVELADYTSKNIKIFIEIRMKTQIVNDNKCNIVNL